MKSTPPNTRAAMKRSTQSGVSLVELMVSMAIGVFLLGAVGYVYVSASSGSRSSSLESQMNEDGTLALEILQQHLRLAGYSTVDAATGNRVFSGLAVRSCDGGFTDNGGTAAFGTLACTTTNTTGSDALAVRYEATPLNSQVAKDAGGVERPANCSHQGITAWIPSAAEGSASALTLADNRFFIAADASNSNIPTLFCRGKDGGAANDGFSAATPLIPNIENIQLELALTAAPQAGKAIPHQVIGYARSEEIGNTAAEWSRVAAVRVCVITRSATPVPAGSNTLEDIGIYFDCAGTQQKPTDRYLRRAYVTTVQLRNMRPGLPAPFQNDGGLVANPWEYLNEASN